MNKLGKAAMIAGGIIVAIGLSYFKKKRDENVDQIMYDAEKQTTDTIDSIMKECMEEQANSLD